jgi:hypothetical protein
MIQLGLKVVEGAPEKGQVVPMLPGSRLRLGRHLLEQGIDLPLTVRNVHRHHAEVYWDNSGLWVGSLTEYNRTLVNGAPVLARPVRIGPCGWLQLADVILQVVWLGPPDPAWLAWGEGTVGRIARGLREARAPGRAFGVLHDALLDAGCDEELGLGHCRDGCPHPADCALLPLLAGGGAEASALSGSVRVARPAGPEGPASFMKPPEGG